MSEPPKKGQSAVIHELGPRLRRPCPNCRRPAVSRFRPFCSQACTDADLGRWLKGDYRIPSEDPEDSDEEPPPGS